MRPTENYRVCIYMNNILVKDQTIASDYPPDGEIIRMMEAFHTRAGTFDIKAYAVYSMGVIEYKIHSEIERNVLK